MTDNLNLYKSVSQTSILEENVSLRKEVEVLKQRLNYDRLTKTLSKSGFFSYFEENANIGDVLYFIDIDDFKSVNDFYGHHIGDRLLSEIAKDLMSSVGSVGGVGRLAGDEFLILMPGRHFSDPNDFANFLCRTAATSSVRVDGVSIARTISIGFVVLDKIVDPEHVVVNANSALRLAKLSGKKQARKFCGKHKCASYRKPSVDELRLGLQKDEINYFLQPIFDVTSNTCIGYEALLRWSRENGEVLGPEHFLDQMTAAYNFDTKPPLAAAHRVADWVTVAQKKKISFNISSAFLSQFISEGSGWISEIVGQAPHDMVIFELVETIVDGDNIKMSDAVAKLRDLGICIALDDFGIGHSTLHRLHSVPVDYVKVDRHFLHAAGISDRGKCILQSIIDLIHISGAAAIVEGVEDEYHLDLVKSCGAAYGQGFFLGKPGPISAWDVSDPDRPVLVR
jgi:diguanylate cyclase (GGDEF)-like protein